jgi:hypothetical protein
MKHKKCEHMMLGAFYGELTPDIRKEFQEHMGGCTICKEKFDRLTASLRTMEHHQRHEPGEDYWSGYWARLEPSLRAQGRQQRKKIDWLETIWHGRTLRFRFAYSIAAALVFVAIGIVLGRFTIRPDGPPLLTANDGQRTSPSARMDNVKRTGIYLDRSRTLLLGIINIDTAGVGGNGIDFSKQTTVSRELVNEGRSLETSLNSPDEAQLRMLVSELEVVMLQIANLEARNDYRAIQIVRDGVDRSALLLKINLEQMQMDTPDKKNDKSNS